VIEEVFPKWKKQLQKGVAPLIGGQLYTERLEQSHDAHIREGGKLLRGFSYRELFKWKRTLKEELLCSKCEKHLLKIASYLKFHVAEFPYTRNLCMRIMHHNLDLKGQEEYEQYPEVRAHIFDFKQAKKPIPEEWAKNPLYLCELSCVDKLTNQKMVTREFPSINAFPDFELNKESKMWLCALDAPTPEQIEEVKGYLRTVIREFGPNHLDVPAPETVLALGPNLYSDGHYARHDFEKPTSTWMDSWTYQRFKTDPRTEREVWLPPKGYKILSSWWHFLTEPVVRRVPWLVGNDQLTDVRKDVHKRFRPSVKIDLKGFGLQFPREYIMAAMDVLNEIYPSEETEDYIRSTKLSFSKLSIMMEDKTFITPNRGVGLGYFSNIMTLVVGSILQDMDIVKMFNDDILCPIENYEKATARLESLSFVINEKKTGGKWYKAPYFAGVAMAPKGSLRFYEAQGSKAALFTKRYHHERKNIFLMNVYNKSWKMAYHYERIFGHEVEKLECFRHPTDLGLNPHGVKRVGWVKGGYLRKLRSPIHEDEERRRVWSITYPWKNPTDKKSFNRQRRVKRYKDDVWYTEYDEYLNPEITELDNRSGRPDFFLGNYQLPRWADLQLLIARAETVGRTTLGVHPKRAAHYMLQYLHSRNPIHSWITGGYEIESPFYRLPGLDPFNQIIYERLRIARRSTYPSINKREGKGAITVFKEGDGINFLRQHLKKEEPIFEEDEANEEDIVFEDDVELLGLDLEEESPDLQLVDEDDTSSELEVTFE
jgi:hypothetical protein